MKKRNSLTYASVYTNAFNKRERLSDWIRKKVVKSRDTRFRWWNIKHIIKITETQTLGKRIEPDLVMILAETLKLMRLDVCLRLRTLQHKIIEYLWRPGGTLVTRHAIESFSLAFHYRTHSNTE